VPSAQDPETTSPSSERRGPPRAVVALVTCAVAFAATALLLRTPQHEQHDDGSGPRVRRGEVEISAEITRPDLASGWVLMADESVARRTPPRSIDNCRALYSWELRQGAIPGGGRAVVHKVTIRAREKVHLRVESIQAQQEYYVTPPPSDSGDAKRSVQMACVPRESDMPPLGEPESGVDVVLETAPTPREANSYIEPTYLDQEYSLTAGTRVILYVLVNPLYGPGEYTYSITLKTSVNGREKVTKLDNDGSYFRWREDGAAFGYSPPRYEWIMLPRRTVIHCPEVSAAVPTRQRPAECD